MRLTGALLVVDLGRLSAGRRDEEDGIARVPSAGECDGPAVGGPGRAGAVRPIGGCQRGFLAGSQALKADALDFVGDGLITLLGVLAIGWSLLWRARSALIQGLFLGVLGLGVVGNTIWRLFSQQPVEAELMGVLALVAVAVNFGAALVLIPHRAGDANVRAVWLFSRNDAIGNAAVLVAAVFVALTGTAWPDLIVAFAIAALFLQSSWVIVRDARRDIAQARN